MRIFTFGVALVLLLMTTMFMAGSLTNSYANNSAKEKSSFVAEISQRLRTIKSEVEELGGKVSDALKASQEKLVDEANEIETELNELENDKKEKWEKSKQKVDEKISQLERGLKSLKEKVESNK